MALLYIHLKPGVKLWLDKVNIEITIYYKFTESAKTENIGIHSTVTGKCSATLMNDLIILL